MLTAITYNCNPDSLDGIPQEAFVEAFENEVYAKPLFANLFVKVTFKNADSEVTSFSSDDFDADLIDEPKFREQFRRLAERAFVECCK